MRIRRKPLPLFSIFTTRIRPISRVDATCVPPSACVSSPTMSTMRTSSIVGRQQVGRRPDDVRDRERLGARQRRASIGRSAAISALHAASHRVLEARRHLGAGRSPSAPQRLHVAAGHQRAEVAEHHAGEHVQPRVRAHQRRAPLVVQRPAHRRARPAARVALGRDQVQLVALARADDPGLRRRPTAARPRPAAGRRRPGRTPRSSTMPSSRVGCRPRRRPTRAPSRPRARAAGSSAVPPPAPAVLDHTLRVISEFSCASGPALVSGTGDRSGLALVGHGRGRRRCGLGVEVLAAAHASAAGRASSS